MPLPDLLSVFNTQPSATLLLSPDWVIVGASDDYLAATLTERDIIVGQYVFDAFPDNPETPEANAVANVRASLEAVLATKQPHTMAPQHYDVPDPARPGHFVERHWQLRHTPVLDAAGEVQLIIQSVQEITTSRLAARQLRESQASEQVARAEAAQQRTEFRHFIEQAPVAVALYHGPEFRVEMANATALAIWDRPLEAVLGRPVFEVLPETATPEVRAIFERVFATGISLTATEQPTTILRHGRPEQVYWNMVFEPQRGPDGRVSGLFTIGTDVTEQVRVRQQVEQLNQELEARVQERTRTGLALQAELLAAAQQRVQAREELYQVFEQAPVIVALLRGPEHFFQYCNPAFQDLFPGRALTGRLYAAAMPEIVAAGLMPELDRVYATGQPYHGTEAPFVTMLPNGLAPSEWYYNFTYQAHREAQQIVGVSIFAFDVTEQVRARQEREAQRKRLHALFMQAPAAICILGGHELVYELVNPSYQELFPGRRLLGRALLDALPEIAGHAVHQGFREVYETGSTREAKALLIPLVRPADGELEDRYFNYIQQARRDADGQPDGVLVFAFEVTEQVRARQVAQAMAAELRESNQQLVRTNVDLDNFIYTASHDLKAPISNIEGLLYLLQDELPAAVKQAAHVGPKLTRMLDSVERFKRTIDHLTEVSKLQKEHAPATALVNLAAVVEDVRQDLLPLLQATGAKLEVDVPALPPIQFSAKNLRSIVYNLLSNALKYHSPDRAPRIDVRAHVRPGHTVLEVHDNGLGIAPAHLPKLYTMFQRFHDHVEGSGIGLYMVKRMVENAGGRIEVHSQLGAGTTFFVHLPQAPAPA